MLVRTGNWARIFTTVVDKSLLMRPTNFANAYRTCTCIVLLRKDHSKNYITMSRLIAVSSLLLAIFCCTQPAMSNTRLLFNDFVAYAEANKVVDLVLIVDRSSGIGEERFLIELRKLAGPTLRRYSVIHPDFTRLAVITFGGDSRVIFDYVSDTANLNTKCGVFGGDNPAPWDEVAYVRDAAVAMGTNLKGVPEGE